MLVIAGPPGCGKSTQVQLLAKAGYGTASAGELLRTHAPANILAQINKGEIVDIDYTNSLVGQALAQLTDDYGPDKIVLDGFPRAVGQATWLLEDYQAKIKTYILLSGDSAIFQQRLRQRSRSDDYHRAIRQRLRVFRANTPPLLDYLASHKVVVKELDATQPAAAVSAQIGQILTA